MFWNVIQLNTVNGKNVFVYQYAKMAYFYLYSYCFSKEH